MLLAIIHFMRDYIKTYISESIDVKEKILDDENLVEQIKKAFILIEKAYQDNNKVLIAGNGGSAADAQHISTELVSKFLKDRKALNAIALTTNTSILTAIGNDYSYDCIFARQIQAYGNKGDVLTGQNECLMDKMCDVLIKVPSSKTPIIQEAHIMIAHIICALVEEKLFN